MTTLYAKILYGKDYWNQLNGKEQREIILNERDCRIEPDDEDFMVYPEDDEDACNCVPF